jgi:hypothetical protein
MECLHKRPAALGFFVAALFGCTAAASESMEPPVLVMYENVGMTGRSVTYSGAVADIDVRYPFHSVSVKSGRWELCTRNDFKGACMDVDAEAEVVSLKKEFGMFARVRSIRPAPEAVAARAVAPAPEIISPPAAADAPALTPVASAEAVLRGHSAHFFRTPMFDGEAIDADDKDAVRNFCREAGFNEVEFSEAMLRAGRSVVGDLLCAGPSNSPK